MSRILHPFSRILSCWIAVLQLLGADPPSKVEENTDDPGRSQAAFIIRVSQSDVTIERKIRSSQLIPWKSIERKITDNAKDYKQLLTQGTKSARALVCIFTERGSLDVDTYRHFVLVGDDVQLSMKRTVPLATLFPEEKQKNAEQGADGKTPKAPQSPH
jgi:hypothetical protein